MQVDPELFFPEDIKGMKAEILHAKSVCNNCHFIEPCLEYALKNDVVGVWGATTEKERWNIRRDKKIPTPKSITLITNAWVKQKGAR
jgi:hypothetical protein